MKRTNLWIPLWVLFLSFSANAGWIVDDAADVGVYNSIAVDETGKAHIACYDADNQDLKYAVLNDSSNWATSVIDSIGDVGSYCSLAVDLTSSDMLRTSQLRTTSVRNMGSDFRFLEPELQADSHSSI